MRRVQGRQEWLFFRILWTADARLAAAWYGILLLRGVLPAVLAVVTGVVVGAVQSGDSLAAPLTALGVVFVLLQVLAPVHLAISQNLARMMGGRIEVASEHGRGSAFELVLDLEAVERSGEARDAA